ncbi:helix-turn-helix domain-containing protein [Paenibacillus assamensis]|uniref:helix-turn-helix domain-containing protein n=1 Tax=Paenibacillus assamensis TaxID=311244 RepID=UPI000421A783|nr:helix-turn-helix domain-containing protein [Paenibacillus assamensis]
MANDRNKSEAVFKAEKRTNPYVMVDKYILSDDRLSWKAKGLLIYLLSKPEGWQVYESDLIKRSKDGRDSVRAGIKELISCGYLMRRQIRENGSFGRMEYIAYEQPIELEMTEITEDGFSVHGDNHPQTENPSAGNTSTENPLLSNNDLSNNDLNMIDCMSASAEIACSSESQNYSNEIYQALEERVTQKCYIANGVTMGGSYIPEIYLMLVNQFPKQLDPEVISIACDLYAARAADLFGNLRFNIDNPVGFFNNCYKDAIKQYKAAKRVKTRR